MSRKRAMVMAKFDDNFWNWGGHQKKCYSIGQMRVFVERGIAFEIGGFISSSDVKKSPIFARHDQAAADPVPAADLNNLQNHEDKSSPNTVFMFSPISSDSGSLPKGPKRLKNFSPALAGHDAAEVSRCARASSEEQQQQKKTRKKKKKEKERKFQAMEDAKSRFQEEQEKDAPVQGGNTDDCDRSNLFLLADVASHVVKHGFPDDPPMAQQKKLLNNNKGKTESLLVQEQAATTLQQQLCQEQLKSTPKQGPSNVILGKRSKPDSSKHETPHAFKMPRIVFKNSSRPLE